MVRRHLLTGFLLAALLFSVLRLIPEGIGAVPPAPGGERTPVLKFSHRQHIESAGMECGTCHQNALTSLSAGDNLFGGKPVCATCHDVEDAAGCNTCHFEGQDPVAWQPRTTDLLFPHATHTAGAEPMACGVCHAGIEKAEGEAPTAFPAMTVCYDCHNDRKLSNTCEQCHTNFAMLVPDDHRVSDFTRRHGDETRLGALTVECRTCHTETFCQECHQGSGLKSFTRRDRMTDPGPRRSTQDAPDPTVLQNVHELNYRFTHGIDARSRRLDCASCHSAQTFCAECHAAGGNITQPQFKPASHLVAGFALIGRGSGGGLHAEEARRDLETCMSCHDIDGQDPTCLTCHTESGSVR